MKNIVLVLSMVILSGCFFGAGKSQVDSVVALERYEHLLGSLGKDDSPYLTKNESLFLNRYKQTSRKDFDFTNKKIAFFTGSSGKSLISKSEVFDGIRERWSLGSCLDSKTSQLSFEVIKEKDRAATGGYDGIICFWCKMSDYSAQLKVLKRKAQ